jgi:hypothetical protein
MLAHALRDHQAGRLREAERIYQRILATDAHQSDSLHLLGMVAYQDGRQDSAVGLIRKAISIDGWQAAYHSNLGTVLQAQGKLEEAATCYKQALFLQPDLAEVHTNLGNIFQALDKLDDAAASHERALALSPYLPEAHYNLGLAQLLKGNFLSGWPNLEWRWHTKDHETPMRNYPQPLWNGKKLTSGRLLLWGEQGVGDEIMFAGLIPEVIQSGNRCVLDCDPRLQSLFARSFPEIEVAPRYDSTYTPGPDIVAHLPSGSLPNLLRQSSAAFAATACPYLFADPMARQRLRQRYADGRRVIGLAWHTNNRKTGADRSVDLSLFAPLFARTDIRWISLQYGSHDELENQAAAAKAPILIDRHVDQLSDIDGFAAQVAAMDMVITIDNSTAHLAGALGVPTWVMLPFARDWRWFQARKDSPWYPTLRLFRQPQRGDWHSVLQQMQQDL